MATEDSATELGATEDAGVELAVVALEDDSPRELAATELGVELLTDEEDLLPPPPPLPPQATRLATNTDNNPCWKYLFIDIPYRGLGS
ncbi:hypothetical protein CBP51_12595 [Cellvibrio mixtus]|uniref:Uncharacterized protein n=1 Tax=Cellvibrio mixtus TaxID=39650 RepID=A0A266QDN2_9GAMM|nr:hypothetical protein CBP51_12595 [Cellvibrio mixtus]